LADSANFGTSVQSLLLIQQLSASRLATVDRFYRTLYELLLDPRLASSSKQTLFFNLLLRSLRNDLDSRRVKAFVKRIMQIQNLHQPPLICGLLYVIGNLYGTVPDLITLLNQPEERAMNESNISTTNFAIGIARTVAQDSLQSEESELPDRSKYDGHKRDPGQSNAQSSCLWEIVSS
jgi:ribosome biogenesis protein MAK21